jgi:hypothetical protein
MDSVNADFIMETNSLKRELTSIFDSIDRLKCTIKMKDEQNATTTTLHRIQYMCSRRTLDCAWRVWQQLLIEDKKKRDNELVQNRVIQRMINQSVQSKLDKSFKKWIRCKDSIKMQTKHLGRVYQILANLLNFKERDAFIIWNRFIVMTNELGRDDDDNDDSSTKSVESCGDIEELKAVLDRQHSSVKRIHNLGIVMTELSNDTEGKFNAIVRELKHLQNVDIKYLQKSLASTKEEFRNKLENEARTIYHATDKNISAIDKEFHMQFNPISKSRISLNKRKNQMNS